jgi:hypothetical protein
VSIVPEATVAGRMPGLIVRPLRPALPYTLALIELRDAVAGPALEIVRDVLLALRTDSERRNALVRAAKDRTVMGAR